MYWCIKISEIEIEVWKLVKILLYENQLYQGPVVGKIKTAALISCPIHAHGSQKGEPTSDYWCISFSEF